MLQSWQAQRAVLESLHRTAHTAAYDAERRRSMRCCCANDASGGASRNGGGR
jgi:hypothetical protein